MAMLQTRVNVTGRTAVAGRRVAPQLTRRVCVVVRATAVAAPPEAPAQAIILTPEAMVQLRKLRSEYKQQDDMLLRVGVKQGGCSGLSYQMDFETADKITEDDHVISYDDGFRLVVEPKSLLYLFGMRLGFSNALIGGGFQFHNPNATDACGCGKSFGV